MPAAPVRVLVLYHRPLLGQGLEQMLSGDAALEVSAVEQCPGASIEEALATDPTVVVVEAGGSVDPLEVFRRSRAHAVMTVDPATGRGWTLRRDPLDQEPEEVLRLVHAAAMGLDRA